MSARPKDDLYGRYQDATTAHRGHKGSCTTCTDTERCPTGRGLFETFTRLQDAYLKRHQRS
ncbi:hypothetical protein [Streptomyces sp. NPDC058595]|uniref:hypothetical protein n=1 Tax=Streptomyces sp. NPDC058595 TaxID=3346550 RepID=UPI003649ED25